MKKSILVLVLFCVGLYTYASNGSEPVYEIEGNLVAVTTFYENGQIKEQGFYKNKKLHGEWSLYNKEGDKITKANYSNGKKIGTWMFMSNGKLTEVQYENNTIAKVFEWNDSKTVAIEQE
ncbi:MAG: hypothetical protein BM563_03210 [Bacteroidetes bacterium MedPE-SWsnd-G1]|nr:MAG: hypothetical protein BM563_03210 [Bacteroidetes bacterium MedPE-SWsnd-G1]